jgi:hypothetical protein
MLLAALVRSSFVCLCVSECETLRRRASWLTNRTDDVQRSSRIQPTDRPSVRAPHNTRVRATIRRWAPHTTNGTNGHTHPTTTHRPYDSSSTRDDPLATLVTCDSTSLVRMRAATTTCVCASSLYERCVGGASAFDWRRPHSSGLGIDCARRRNGSRLLGSVQTKRFCRASTHALSAPSIHSVRVPAWVDSYHVLRLSA